MKLPLGIRSKLAILHVPVLLVTFTWIHTFGQEEARPLLERIQEAYNQFNYTEVVSLAFQALEAEPPLPQQEQVEIYTYLAFAHVALGKRDEAIQDFKAALELDPNVTLDPMYVSPKIIALFEEVKSAKEAEREEQRIPVTVEKDKKFEGAWRSLVLPGWGQFHKGHKRKAIAIFTLQAINVSGLVYTQFKMERAHDAYLEAKVESDMDAHYDRYNRFYKLRNYFALSTLMVWLYSHIDAALTAPAPQAEDTGNENTSFLTPAITRDTISLTYVIRF